MIDDDKFQAYRGVLTYQYVKERTMYNGFIQCISNDLTFVEKSLDNEFLDLKTSNDIIVGLCTGISIYKGICTMSNQEEICES